MLMYKIWIGFVFWTIAFCCVKYDQVHEQCYNQSTEWIVYREKEKDRKIGRDIEWEFVKERAGERKRGKSCPKQRWM